MRFRSNKVFGYLAGLCLAISVASALEQPWYHDYEYGVKLYAKGDFAGAKAVMERVRDLKPFPEANAWTYGTWRIDYDPYYYLGMIYIKTNDEDAAARAFRTSEQFGVASRDPQKRQQIAEAVNQISAH